MTAFVIFIHVVTCVLVVATVLMQSGRGGGLTEGFASAESMFGAHTNDFMVRMTSIFAGIFLVTSLTLAYFSARSDQSLMGGESDLDKLLEDIPVVANVEIPAGAASPEQEPLEESQQPPNPDTTQQ
ncbi:MAG: preprotein translocase subunit SecG [Candidatus Omnitrophota bacterium]